MLKSKIVKIVLVLIGAILVSGGFLIYSYNAAISGDKVLMNVYAQETNLGNLEKEDAEKLLNQKNYYGNINLHYNGENHTFNLEELGCKFNIDSTISKAFEIGRSGDWAKDIVDYIKLKYLKENIVFEVDDSIPDNLEEQLYNLISDDIERDSRNASVVIGSSINVTRGEIGIGIDREKFKKAIYESLKSGEDISLDVPVIEVEPDVSSDELNKINGIIGSYKTTFSENLKGRNENIRVAANYMDNLLLMPGDIFSYNEVTKLKTEKNGYKKATVIVNGEIEEGLGGGVCQVSSTLYNSVLYSGLEIVQRRAHSIPSNYVAYGRDATVSDNSIDFKFKNNHDFPVYLKTFVGSNSVTVSIYGNKESVPNIEITSQVVSKKAREIKYINDPTLKKGEKVIKTKGRDEIRSETYVIVDGVKKLVTKDRYPSQTKVVLVGTKEAKKIAS
ncbi:MAG: VanW family protein [Proteocatella sp.]